MGKKKNDYDNDFEDDMCLECEGNDCKNCVKQSNFVQLEDGDYYDDIDYGYYDDDYEDGDIDYDN